MNKILSLFLVCGFLGATVSAQPTETPGSEPPNRFLFVFENSSAMKRSAKAAQKTVRELIESGVQGEMRAGDTFGIWTFDDQLNTTFPVVRWSPTDSKIHALKVEDFLKQHRYENKAPLNTVLPKVYSLIKASKYITVILITTGTEAIRGTPFDAEINTIYPQYARELRDAKIPFVTVLIGYNGRPVAYSVNSSLTIQIPQPPLKPEKAAAETNAVVAAADVPVTPAKPAAVPKPETNQVAAPKAPPIAANETQTKETGSVAPAISTNISKPIVAPPVALSSSTEKTKPVLPAPVATPEPANVTKENSVTPVAASTAAIPPAEPAEKIHPPAVTAISNAAPVAVTNATSEKPSEPSVVASSEPPAVRESAPEIATIEPTETESPEITPAPMATAQPVLTPKLLLAAGGVLVLVAGVLVFLLFRQPAKSQLSLISHSIDGKK